MENSVKGKRYDVGNNSRYCRYCGNGYQYHRYNNQYLTDFKET